MTLFFSKFVDEFYKTDQNAVILTQARYQKIETADLTQIIQSSFQVIQFI